MWAVQVMSARTFCLQDSKRSSQCGGAADLHGGQTVSEATRKHPSAFYPLYRLPFYLVMGLIFLHKHVSCSQFFGAQEVIICFS